MSSEVDEGDQDPGQDSSVDKVSEVSDVEFTLFIVLPNEDVCTLRSVQSGIRVFDLKGKLELISGIPAQIYFLQYPDGESLDDSRRLLIQDNIKDGYLLRMQLYENWESLYLSIIKNNIEHVFHGGGVHLKGNVLMSPDETERVEGVVRERGGVALFLASFQGLLRMVNMLLSVGCGISYATPFGRSALQAAVAKDHEKVCDVLLKNGSSLSHQDIFGHNAMDTANSFSAAVCAKKLRLMKLNLRGRVGKSANAVSGLYSPRTNEPRVKFSTREYSDGTERPITVAEMSRACSKLSYTSDDSLFSKQSYNAPLHKSRKYLSSSAPAKEHVTRISVSDNSKILSRVSEANLKWREIPHISKYWRVVDFTPKNAAVEDAVDVKAVPILEQKQILKFKVDPGDRHDAQIQTDVEQTTQGDAGTKPPRSALSRFSSATSRKSVKFSKSAKRKGAKQEETWEPLSRLRSVRRKINLAANQGNSETSQTNSVAFNNWLTKKRLEAERAEEEEETDSCASEPEEQEEMSALEKLERWTRKHNKLKVKPKHVQTPGSRPIPDVIQIGSAEPEPPSRPSADDDISSYREWLKNKAYNKPVSRNKTANDFMMEKRRLEEKRQKLLVSAISYDEWMQHSEDRKFLIKRILKADLEEMRRLEAERIKSNGSKLTFDEWKEKIKQREAEDRKRKQMIRYDEGYANAKRLGTSSAAVPYEVWLRRKLEEAAKRKEGYNISRQQGSGRERNSSNAYEQWLMRKHNEQLSEIEMQLEKEREMLGMLRQRQIGTVVS